MESENLVRLIGSKLDSARKTTWGYQSGACLFKLNRAEFHCREIQRIYRHIEGLKPESFNYKIGVRGAPHEELFYSLYEGPFSESLIFHVDAFFEAAKSSADFVLNMMGCVKVLQNPPTSLNDFLKKKHKIKKDNNVNVVHVLDAYWEQGGKLIKEYRDCLTHYAVLRGAEWQTPIQVKCENQNVVQVRLFLPDNPDANSHKKFRFDDNVDARELSSDLLDSLNKMVQKVLLIAGVKLGLKEGDSVENSMMYLRLGVGTW